MFAPDPSTIISLAGTWCRSVGGVDVDLVEVPGSYAPVGICRLERVFIVPWKAVDLAGDERLVLVTQGVLATARFILNGHELGTAGAWATYRFEIPPGLLRPGENSLQAEIHDLVEAFGPMPGRRFDGGLVRPIWIERRPATLLSDVLFRPGLNADATHASVSIAVSVDGPVQQAVEVQLAERATGTVVARGTATPERPFTAELERPQLWSPERPTLYVLTATLPGRRAETWIELVGFRRIDARGQDLFLNGRRLLLKGVCRHEFTDAHGYAPPDGVIRRELLRIKHAGFNYVRLVHSPPAPAVCRLAAEVGLLVSEEPGTCWHDLGNDAIAAPAVECLRRTILRDRNSPSILAWFIYNECNPHTGYAVRIAQMCRSLDPDCRLAMADASGNDSAIMAMAQAADLTFYGINIYATRKTFIERMAALNDRPLVITEWSGFLGQGNDRQLRDFCDVFVRHGRVEESQRVSGGSIWVWADYEEHSRPSPASIHGWTVEGLVHADGRPKPDLQILSQMCFDMDHPPERPVPRITILSQAPRRSPSWSPVPVPVIAQEDLERRMDQARRIRDMDNWLTVPAAHDGYAYTPDLPRFGRLLVDGIEFRCRDEDARRHPLLLGPGVAQVVIPVGGQVLGVAVLGHVMVGGGYPSPPAHLWAGGESSRAFNDSAAEYQFVYADGTTVVQPLRHGVEILRHNDICRWWTPAARSPSTRPALRSVIDDRYEILRLDLWERSLPPGELREIRWVLRDPEALLLMAGLSVLRPQPGT